MNDVIAWANHVIFFTNRQDNPIMLFVIWKIIRNNVIDIHLFGCKEWQSCTFSNEKCAKSLWIVISILIDSCRDFYPELKRISLNLPDLQLLPFGDNDGDLFSCSHLNDRGSLLCQAQIEIM